jgi:hypothetical protein
MVLEAKVVQELNGTVSVVIDSGKEAVGPEDGVQALRAVAIAFPRGGG